MSLLQYFVVASSLFLCPLWLSFTSLLPRHTVSRSAGRDMWIVAEPMAPSGKIRAAGDTYSDANAIKYTHSTQMILRHY